MLRFFSIPRKIYSNQNIRLFVTSNNQLLPQIEELIKKSDEPKLLFDQIDDLKNNTPDLLRDEIHRLKKEILEHKNKNDWTEIQYSLLKDKCEKNASKSFIYMLVAMTFGVAMMRIIC